MMRRAWVTVFLFVMGGVAAGRLTGAEPQERVQYDVHGRVVRTANGERISYPPSGDAERPAALPPSTTSTSVVLPPSGPPSITVAIDSEFATAGVGIGRQGLFAGDLDGDGRAEIVATAGPIYFFPDDRWYVLARRGGQFVQEWRSPIYPDGLGVLIVANADADPALEILVSTGNRVLIYDGATRVLERTLYDMPANMSAMVVADVDGDGSDELVSCAPAHFYFDGYDLYVHDLATGRLEREDRSRGGTALAVGNVMGGPGLQIVVSDGTIGYVLDGRTHAVLWTKTGSFYDDRGFGRYLQVADLDGDGRAEIVAGYQWYTGIVVFDAVTRSAKASLEVFNVDALTVVDTDGDGRPEVLYGDAQWGSIHVLDASSLGERWAYSKPDDGVTRIVWGDTDGRQDGQGDLIFGAGYGTTGPDHLSVVDGSSRALVWRSDDLEGPFSFAFGDVDADGQPELVSGSISSDSYYGDGRWLVHDARTHDLEFQSGPTTGLDWMGLSRVAVANVDADPQLEVFVAASYLYQGTILCYDGLTHAQQWSQALPDGLAAVSTKMADLDGDGTLEIVVGTSVVYSGEPSNSLFVLDAATGAIEWQIPTPGALSWSLMRIANVDSDPQPEIILVGWTYDDGRLAIVDGLTHQATFVHTPIVTALDVVDPDGDGVFTLVVGTEKGRLATLDPRTGLLGPEVGRYGARIDGLAVKDVDADGIADYTFGIDDQVVIVSGLDGHLLWSSGTIGNRAIWGRAAGRDDRLMVADLDDDGRLELAVSVGDTGYIVYELRPGADPVITVDDVEVELGEAGGVLSFSLTLSRPSTEAVSVSFRTVNGSATAGEDFLARASTVAFAPGQTRVTVDVPVQDDRGEALQETFSLHFFAPLGAALSRSDGMGIIDKPCIDVEELSEGTSGERGLLGMAAPGGRRRCPIGGFRGSSFD